MSELILYTTEDGKGQISVVNRRLTTAVDGKNCRVEHRDLRTIWPFPILYTPCKELPSPTRLSKCQGMLDSSGIQTLPEKQLASDRFVARCVANSTSLARH